MTLRPHCLCALAACLALGCAGRGRRLGTWDRLLVPRPFTKIAIAVGEPHQVGKDADIDAEREWLERKLDSLNARAAAALGIEP